jgi:dimeric dUTPase (all-alpha-NTP-PPase superfamily)
MKQEETKETIFHLRHTEIELKKQLDLAREAHEKAYQEYKKIKSHRQSLEKAYFIFFEGDLP